MKPSSSQPIRLVDLRAQNDPASLARLVRSARSAPEDPVPQLKWRIRRSLRRKSARRQRTLRAVLLGGVVLLAGGVMAAVMQPILRRWERTSESATAAGSSRPAAQPRHRRSLPPSRASTEVPQASLPPVPAPPPEFALAEASSPSLDPSPSAPSTPREEPSAVQPLPPRVSVVRRPPTTVPVRPSVTPIEQASSLEQSRQIAMLDPPAWPEGQVAAHGGVGPSARSSTSPRIASATVAPVGAAVPAEQALLTMAIRSLRSEHQPRSALATLDDYMARFPNGNLRPEAARLRTEALLALGHKPAALAELNREQTRRGAGGEETRLVRGELRAAAGQWREALEDFDSVVRVLEANGVPTSSPRMRERFERALWGRSSARSHLGDEAGARTDLREYLHRFPQGRFAGQAAHLLGELR